MKQYSFAALVVANGDGTWHVRTYRDDFSDIDLALDMVRRQRAEAAAFALLCVDDDYFVIARPHPERPRLFLSDATMAVDDDFAADILDRLDINVPDIDPDELDDIDGWPDGDADILSDLGLSEEILTVVADDSETYPHEQLMRIAEELSFENELADAADIDD